MKLVLSHYKQVFGGLCSKLMLGFLALVCLCSYDAGVSASEMLGQTSAVLGNISEADLSGAGSSNASPRIASETEGGQVHLDKKAKIKTPKKTEADSKEKAGALSFEEAMRQARELAAQGETLSVEQPEHRQARENVENRAPPVLSKAEAVAPLKPSPTLPSLSEPKALPPVAPPKEVASLPKIEAASIQKEAPSEPKREEAAPVSPPKMQAPPFKSPPVSASIVRKSEANDFVSFLGQVGQVDDDVASNLMIKADMVDPLSLDEAVSAALRTNFEVQAFDARMDSTKWDRVGAYSQYLPSVEFTYAEGAEKSMPGSYNGPDGSRISETTHHRRDRSLFIRQPIIDLVIVSDIMKSHDVVSVADAERRDMKESTVFSTVTAFFKLLQARKAIELADEYKIVLNGLAQRMQARLEEGGATNADTDRIHSRIKVAEASRLEAIGSYGTTLSEFKRITGLAPSQYKMPTKLVPDVPATAAEALEMALKNNPSYLSSLMKIDIAAGDRNKSYAGILPKLSVEYSNAYNYNAGGSAHGNPIDGVYPAQDDTRVMLVARWSLTAGTSLAAGMSGISKVREMRFKSQDVRARLEQGMYTAYDALNAARKRSAILKDAYLSDKRIVADLEEQFLHGDRSLFEILDSQDRLYNTKMQLLATLFTEAQICYQIRLQMGEIAKAVLLTDMAGS